MSEKASGNSEVSPTDLMWRATRRGRLGWYGYDWANSVFTTSVTSIFFGPFITDISDRAADAEGYLHPLGIPVLSASFFPYLTGLSVFLQIFVLPTAAAMTRRHGKGALLGVLACCGSGAAISMYAIGQTDYVLGGVLYVVAVMALGASITVANTYLPVLARPERQDRASAEASAAGFLSSGAVLLLDLLLYTNHEGFGLTEDQAVRVILLTTGIWWLVFSAMSVWLLRGYGAPPLDAEARRVGTYRTLLSAARRLRAHPVVVWFLVAFFFYNNGMNVVTSLVGTFAVKELGIEQDAVVTAVLLVQFVAFAGAFAAGRLAERFGGRTVLLAFVVVWTVAVTGGALIPNRAFGAFLAMCLGAGVVLGGTYALSRSVFVRLAPPNQVAEYIGIFETVNRCLGFAGTATFGLVLQWTGSYRSAWLSAIVFFFVGGVILAMGALKSRSTKETAHA